MSIEKYQEDFKRVLDNLSKTEFSLDNKLKDIIESRFGFGQKNPRIEKGAKGYFSNSLVELLSVIIGEELGEFGILDCVDIDSQFPYDASFRGIGLGSFRYFYMTEEAPNPTYTPLGKDDLYDLMVKETVIVQKINGAKATIESIQLTPATAVLNIKYKNGLSSEATPKELLDLYEYENGGVIGKRKNPHW